MIIVACGVGTNSIALIIECVKRGIEIDLILFADTGGEKPHTYNYLETFNAWLKGKGLQPIVIVKKGGIKESLEQECLRCKCLPSIAYGYKKCSQKYKVQPQDKYVNNWAPAKAEWKAGRKIIKYIGIDADESHRAIERPDDKKYIYQYPLIDWDMGRDECIETIKNAGLCLPGKSACFFCPSAKISEIHQLKAVYPELLERALKMESNAQLSSLKGLGRNYSWANVAGQHGLFLEGYSGTPELTCNCFDG